MGLILPSAGQAPRSAMTASMLDRAVRAIAGSFDDVDLGELRPVVPPCRFGFSSTPRRPSVTSVVTTVAVLDDLAEG